MQKTIIWIIVAIFLGLFLSAGQVRFSFLSAPPPPLPGYPDPFVLAGLEGEIHFNVRFDEGRVVSVEHQSAALKGDDVEQKVALEYVPKFLRKWESALLSPITREVTVEFTIDPGLPERQRKYLLNYDQYGIIEHLEIIAAPLDYGD